MLAILKKYLPRINHVHLKDVRPPVIDQVKYSCAHMITSSVMSVITSERV